MQPLTQKLSTLEQQLTQQSQREQSLRQTAAEQAVEQFRADPKHRYYDDVESLVANLIQKGIVPRTGDLMADLSKAYDQACMLHPEVREALINERVTQTQAAQIASTKEAADKARLASRSVTGSPSSGAATRKPTQRAEGKSYDDDLNEDVAHAVRLVAARA
jgi:phage antirepressor YoqD-like protein